MFACTMYMYVVSVRMWSCLLGNALLEFGPVPEVRRRHSPHVILQHLMEAI